MTEIRRATRALTGAETSDLWLWRARARLGAPNTASRHDRMPSDAVRRRLQAGHAVESRDEAGITLRVPLVHAGRTLGCVQLGMQRDATSAARASLRRYLGVAGIALARTLAEERNARQLRRYEALLDSLPDACLLLLDAHGVIQGVRGHAGGLLGRSPNNVIGQVLAAPEAKRGLLKIGRSRLRTLFTDARAQGKARYEAQIQTDGGEVDVRLGRFGQRRIRLRAA
jgi:PAS domain-containing protein